MRKIVACLLLALIWSECKSQNLTGDYSAFEQLMKDVRSVADSCLYQSNNSFISDISVEFWLEVHLDTNGCICKAKLAGERGGLKESQIACMVQSLLSSSNQYNIYIEDYHYLKDRFWELHKDAKYYIRYQKGEQNSTQQSRQN